MRRMRGKTEGDKARNGGERQVLGKPHYRLITISVQKEDITDNYGG